MINVNLKIQQFRTWRLIVCKAMLWSGWVSAVREVCPPATGGHNEGHWARGHSFGSRVTPYLPVRTRPPTTVAYIYMHTCIYVCTYMLVCLQATRYHHWLPELPIKHRINCFFFWFLHDSVFCFSSVHIVACKYSWFLYNITRGE